MQKDLALFNGIDSTDHRELWVTDGTSAGTWEISVTGADPDFNGLDPTAFIPFGNKVLFIGTDVADHSALWITDGTSPGTSELTTVGGTAVTNGTASPLIFGSEILFAGGPFGNLWVSDGTLPGTSQILVAGVAWSGLDVSNLIVLGN